MTDVFDKNNIQSIITLNYVRNYVNGRFVGQNKKEYIKSFEYLNRYLYVLDNISHNTEKESGNSGIIWQCWLQGAGNMPELVKVCTESVKQYNQDKKIILITEKNIKEYISVPDYITEKYQNGLIPPALYTDVIRLMLLEKYGGVWIDSTVFLTGVLPEEAFSSDFFTLKNPLGICFNYVKSFKDLEVICNFLNCPMMLPSTWFISSSPNNIIISGWLKLLLEYWKYENAPIDYFMMDYFFVLLLLNNPACRKIYTDCADISTVPANILQSAMPEEFDSNLYDTIKSMTPLHKLTKNYYPDNTSKSRFYNKIIQGL